MAKKQLDVEIKELKELLKTGRVIIGTDRTYKLLKTGKIEKIYLSSNCPESIKQDLEHYNKINSFDTVELKQSNEELGIICKKPFHISIIGLLKGEK